MVGPFGGSVAATLLRAALEYQERLGDPLSVTVNFTGPIGSGRFDITARLVRGGKSTQHWYLELVKEGEVCANATAVFVTERQTWESTEIQAPQAPPFDEVPRFPKVPGAQEWLNRYAFGFIRGGLRALPQYENTRHDTSETLLWVRDEPPRPLDHLSLLALSDVFLPRLFVRLQQINALVGTVSLTTYFHAGQSELDAQGDRELLGRASATRFRAGFFDQTAELWSVDKTLLATSVQMVYFRE